MPSIRCAVLLVCLLGAARAGCPEDSVAGDDGQCKCVLPCPKLVCQPGQQPVRVREAIPERPGSCCPLYECRNQVPLSWLDDGAGQGSGGSCLDLRGQPREVGERWQDEDEPCMSCRCEPGTGLHCHTPMCRSCSQPEAKLAGECCPRCPPLCPPAPRPCHLRCPMGLDTDPLGCPVCRCRTSQQNEVSECKQLDECGLVCVHGLARDERGCDVCECRSCPSRSGCDIHCPHGYRLDRHGCPSCECEDGCVDEGNTTRTAGSTWSSEPCRSCSCGPNGHILCNETVCSVGCSDPVAPPPGHCCPTCPQVGSEWRGWGTMPVVLIVVLSLLCVLLMVHVVRGRFRARLAPSDAPGDGFVGLPQQYYKCIPVYETPPVLRHADKIDKIGPL